MTVFFQYWKWLFRSNLQYMLWASYHPRKWLKIIFWTFVSTAFIISWSWGLWRRIPEANRLKETYCSFQGWLSLGGLLQYFLWPQACWTPNVFFFLENYPKFMPNSFLCFFFLTAREGWDFNKDLRKNTNREQNMRIKRKIHAVSCC